MIVTEQYKAADGTVLSVIIKDITEEVVAREKERLRQELPDIRWNKTQTMQYGEITTAADSAMGALTGAVVGMQTAINLGLATEDTEMTWKLAPSVFVQLNFAGLVQLGMAVRGHIQACFEHEASLNAQIEAATTPEDLAAIDIESGWPE